MDVSQDDHSNEHEHEREQDGTDQTAGQFPLPARLSPSSYSPSSSLDFAGGDSYVHPPSPEMDGSADRRRRRRTLVGEGKENGDGDARRKFRSQRRRKGSSRDPHGADSDESSDFSSRSTSEDVELHHIASEDEWTEDEETGLAKKDNRNRKRRRRKNTLLDQRIIRDGKTSKLDTAKSADRSVLWASFVNTLLIGSWYFFSLSISIVSQKSIQLLIHSLKQSISIISGCSRISIFIFHSLFSQPACICLSSSRLLQ